jgi:3-isopropylmalate/(R)-2-methylmalate dehydratase small subunit
LELKETSGIADGDILEIDLKSGKINNLTQKSSYQTEAFPEFLQEIIQYGGLINRMKKGK